MKRVILLAILALGFNKMHAQESKISNDLSIGFQLNEYGGDFGMGLNVTSPYFFKGNVAVRLRGNLMFLEHLDALQTTWTPYSNLTLGLVSGGSRVGKNIRLYGEGGVIMLIPSADFSSQETEFGGYGLFGFEFYMFDRGNYFIEIGGVGTGARADIAPLDPIYSNGLLISTGFRVHL